MKCAVIGPGIQEPLSIRDFRRQGRGEAAGHGNWRSVLSLVPRIWEDPSFRDLLAGGRERRGGPSWPPGVRPYNIYIHLGALTLIC